MSTLIAAYKGREMIGRCDARCYDARSHTCKCICYGANHGAGYARALEQTERHGQRWLERYLEERGLARADVTVTGRGLSQLEMRLDDSGLPSRRVAALIATDETAAFDFWTVHRDPIDRPGTIVARRWRIAGRQITPDRKTMADRDLAALRSRMPDAYVVVPPAADDPDTVAEVWMPADRAAGDAARAR